MSTPELTDYESFIKASSLILPQGVYTLAPDLGFGGRALNVQRDEGKYGKHFSPFISVRFHGDAGQNPQFTIKRTESGILTVSRP